MERSRLKNIIILILALVNVALAISLGLRMSQGYAAQRALLAELRTRFETEGVSLPRDIPQKSVPDVVTLERSTALEEAIAAAALGDGSSFADEGGGITAYRSDSGQMTFRVGGSFSLSLHLSQQESSSVEQAEELARRLAKAAGFESPTLLSGSGSAAQRYEGYPVVGAGTVFSLRGSTLTAEGSYLPTAYLSRTAGTQMSAATALTRFLNFRSQSGAVISAVTEIQICYVLQSSSAATMTLSPAWLIATDSGDYLVNCDSGSVSRR